MAEIHVVITTVPPADADRIVRTLVQERLVACGNVVPAVRSTYVWKGELCSEEESLVVMETPRDRVTAATARLRMLHPYECPKIVVLDPEHVNDDYAAWAIASTRP
ncbi:MAG TPA: divalent-cation tolerance protein CutA [Nannocystaceae bacterium]|nr:divalent-cation tolerance protein CutA [Nannocystaceae bacterium]